MNYLYNTTNPNPNPNLTPKRFRRQIRIAPVVDQVIPEKEAPAEVNANPDSNTNEAEFEKDLVGIYAVPVNVANVTKVVVDDAKDASMEDATPNEVANVVNDESMDDAPSKEALLKDN
jgi:hypothetical protein